jgi:heme exporter protein A
MLSVSQLSLERYFQPVFQPLNFNLEAGELLLVSGANGCGKTTLIRLLAGVLYPSSGRVDSQATSTAYVGHQLAIKDELSVTENLRFMRDFLGGTAANFDEVIDRVGLRRVSGQLARTLSAGQRKRCALARLLLAEADLWLLDEPYSNLDQEGVALVDTMLAGHLETGGSCVLATHGAHRPEVENIQEQHLVSGAVEL